MKRKTFLELQTLESYYRKKSREANNDNIKTLYEGMAEGVANAIVKIRVEEGVINE